MTTISNIQNRELVFSGWSRKGYAIFSSLSKVVKIARLAVAVIISSFGKSGVLIRLFNENFNYNLIEEFDDDRGLCLSDLLEMIFPEPAIINIDSSCCKLNNV